MKVKLKLRKKPYLDIQFHIDTFYPLCGTRGRKIPAHI